MVALRLFVFVKHRLSILMHLWLFYMSLQSLFVSFLVFLHVFEVVLFCFFVVLVGSEPGWII